MKVAAYIGAFLVCAGACWWLLHRQHGHAAPTSLNYVSGDLSAAQLARFREALATLSFPVPELTVSRLLGRQIDVLPTESLDWAEDLERKGRIGGNLIEYRLSDDAVLLLATAYYSKEDVHFSMEEWAVILSPAERGRFSRPIYPNPLDSAFRTSEPAQPGGRPNGE